MGVLSSGSGFGRTARDWESSHPEGGCAFREPLWPSALRRLLPTAATGVFTCCCTKHRVHVLRVRYLFLPSRKKKQHRALNTMYSPVPTFRTFIYCFPTQGLSNQLPPYFLWRIYQARHSRGNRRRRGENPLPGKRKPKQAASGEARGLSPGQAVPVHTAPTCAAPPRRGASWGDGS